MKRATSLFLAFVSLLALSSTAKAQLFRAYVASYGNDTNPCSVAAPCRLVPAALNAVASGGEIWMLDSANFNTGTVNITKSVSILSVPGAVGSIVAFAGGPAVTIHTAGVNVALRNVLIANNVVNPGTYGIEMTSGKSLVLEQCVMNGLPQEALHLGGNPMHVYVRDCDIRNGGDVAIRAYDGAMVDVARTKMTENYFGGAVANSLTATGTTQITVTDSVISGNPDNPGPGLMAIASTAGGVAKVFATHVSITNVWYGLVAYSGGTLEIDNSMVTGNRFNVFVSGGTIKSLGNNHISDGTDSGSLTPLAPR